MANEQNLRPSKSDLHPTMKPIGLLAIQIKNSSKIDDIILMVLAVVVAH